MHGANASGLATRSILKESISDASLNEKSMVQGTEVIHSPENTIDVLRRLQANLQSNTTALQNFHLNVATQRQSPITENCIKIKKNHCVGVELNISTREVRNVDFAKQTFDADVIIEARWHESALDELNSDDVENIKWNDYWNPQLSVTNMCGQPRSSSSVFTLCTGKHGVNMTLLRFHLVGTFFFIPNLSLYPFDEQNLPIIVQSRRGNDEIEFSSDEFRSSCVCSFSATTCPGFVLLQYMDSESDYRENTVTSSLEPYFSASCSILRRWPRFILNPFLSLMMVLCSAVIAFKFLEAKRELVVIFTLLLAMTAKFLPKDRVQNFGSFTLADLYINFNIVTLLFMMLLEVIILAVDYGFFSGIVLENCYYNYVFFFIAFIFITFNTAFMMGITVVVVKRYLRLSRKAKEISKKQNDYKRLRSAREQSVQSFSALIKDSVDPGRKRSQDGSSKKPKSFYEIPV